MFQKIQKLWIIVKFLENRDVIVGYANKSGYKLPLLYKERTEAGLAGCQGEFNFLHKAVEFYDVFEHHLKIRLSKADQYMRLHFASKWNIKRNVYRYMIAEQKKSY